MIDMHLGTNLIKSTDYVYGMDGKEALAGILKRMSVRSGETIFSLQRKTTQTGKEHQLC